MLTVPKKLLKQTLENTNLNIKNTTVM